MKRAFISALAVVALVAGATVAEAAISTGKYNGDLKNKALCGPPGYTSPCADGKISVRIKSSSSSSVGRRVTRIAWTDLHLRCEDEGDGNPNDDQDLNSGVATGSINLNSNNKFDTGVFNFGSTARRVQVKGKAKNNPSRIVGSIRMQEDTDANDNIVPGGDFLCDSGTAKFAAYL